MPSWKRFRAYPLSSTWFGIQKFFLFFCFFLSLNLVPPNSIEHSLRWREEDIGSRISHGNLCEIECNRLVWKLNSSRFVLTLTLSAHQLKHYQLWLVVTLTGCSFIFIFSVFHSNKSKNETMRLSREKSSTIWVILLIFYFFLYIMSLFCLSMKKMFFLQLFMAFNWLSLPYYSLYSVFFPTRNVLSFFLF